MTDSLPHNPPENDSEIVRSLQIAESILSDSGIESSRFEVQLLLSMALGVSRSSVIARIFPSISNVQWNLFLDILAQRSRRIPLAYIRGTQEFYGLEFEVNENVLIPRPETELLVDFALSLIQNPVNQHNMRRYPILDVGTGSGCILLSILKYCADVKAVGIDISMPALETAKVNAARHQLLRQASFFQGDLLAGIKPRSVSLIVSNPPYIPLSEISTLQPEVSLFEPKIALAGSDYDGLGAYRNSAKQSKRALLGDGWLAVEVGQGQAKDVQEIFESVGFVDIIINKDLAQIERMVAGRNSDM